MREVELKSLVDEVGARRARVELAGGRLVFKGRLLDTRYDFPDRSMTARDHVLRLRVYETDDALDARLEWKGETRYEDGFKVRDELSAISGDPETLEDILERLGFIVTMEIDRDIIQYHLGDAIVRFEQYPDMDPLVEVEGTPEAIEAAIEHIGLPRDGFSSDRLLQFIARFEARTGRQAAVSEAEFNGDRKYREADA
jgi:adenylate cyclase class IV